MIALLAIVTHICSTQIDDSIASVVREKHANNLSKIESGEEGYEELFVFACPKFVNPAVPNYEEALTAGSPLMPYGQDTYKLQVHHFMNEMAAHQTLRKMKSYMCLYTSIGVEKLASFNDMKVEEFEPWLACFKHKMQQLERGTEANAQDKMGTAMGIHYYVAENTVHVDEAEKTRRFETFFMKQIANNDDILRQIERLRLRFDCIRTILTSLMIMNGCKLLSRDTTYCPTDSTNLLSKL
jgi:translation initiation factor 3 subunit L